MASTTSHQESVDEVLRRIGMRPFALWISPLTPPKSPLEVIDIARAIPEMDFVMLGWGSDKLILNRLVTEKPSNLYYLGPVPDGLKCELIQKCSVGLTTSKYEGFGMTPLEFLVAGKPVLAYPLQVFKEIYGSLVTYVCNVAGFVSHLKSLYEKGFHASIKRSEINRLQDKYDLGKAVLRIIRQLKLRSLTIFAQDAPGGSDSISGFYQMQWRLWQMIRNNGIDLRILARGNKFSTKFSLADRTVQIGQSLLLMEDRISVLEQSTKLLDRMKSKLLEIGLTLLEPLCYVHGYIVRMGKASSKYVIAIGYSQIFAASILKFIFRFKLACVIFDARFCDVHALALEGRQSFPLRAYYLLFAFCLRCADRIMLVSQAIADELLSFYPHEDRLFVIWGE